MMNKRNFLGGASIMVAVILFLSCSRTKQTNKMKPPIAEKVKKELTLHDDTRIDNYFWMRLTDEQKNAEEPDDQTKKVLDYLKAENAYKNAVMKHTEDFQQELYNEIVGRIKQDDESVPYLDNGYYYYTRYEEGNEYPLYCRKKGALEAEEEIMLNVNDLAEGYEYFHATGISVSPDNKLLAYGIDTISRRRYTIYFKNLETGELLDDQIPNTTGGPVWANDNETVFYTVKNLETLRSEWIKKHKLGIDPAGDKEVFHEADEEFSVGIGKSKSKKFLLIYSRQTLSSEVRFLDANNPDGEFCIIQPREKDLEYGINHYGDYFYIRTNKDGAKNFKLMKTPVDDPGMENWVDVIPHRDDVLLQSVEIFSDYLVLNERINGLLNLRIIPWDDSPEHYIDFGEETYTARISVNPEFDTKILRYGYSSLTTPYSTFDYNMETREKALMKEEEVLGGFDKNNYETKRLWATADDGTKVPISLVYRKPIDLDGTNPLLLSAYGSYGYSRDPYFSSDRLSLLDRGFVFAIAHIRGGSEMGRWWYEDGKLLKKKNTFTDFNYCAEYLIKTGYTSPDKLFAIGGSAGGLLMGAIVNMQPELYKGVVAAVPWVDVVTTMLDESIPLTTGEFDEWGDPKEKEYYDYILSYSPYDNVTAQKYPNMLVTTGLWDSQVQYWEPAKWVAKLRDKKTDDNRLLLHINMEAGHGGASGRFKRYKETALEYAFMLDLVK
ncbi:MAG: S9 family peptidase [Bacteroidetes bacterium]|nr:S9 family peptidase [Bacteroidota bacterium]